MELKNELHRVTAFYLVVITSDVGPQTINEIFDLAWKLQMVNFYVLMKTNESNWSLFTYIPYQHGCQTVIPRIMETFTPENYTEQLKVPFSELYFTKISNLNGCTVRVAVVQVEPYVITNYNETHSTFDGIDVRIVREVAKSMNFNPEFLIPKDGKARGIIYDNGTATGAVKMVNRMFE